MPGSLRTVLISVLLLLTAVKVFADDLEIFDGQMATVKPNVMLIFDNSSSMEDRPAGASSGQTKLQIARDVLLDIIDKTAGVRFGLMSFNKGSGGDGGRVWEACGTSKERLKYRVNYIAGSLNPAPASPYPYYGNTGTPLGEALAEAGLYFAGMNGFYAKSPVYGASMSSPADDPNDPLATSGNITWYANPRYVSPIRYSCQKNYIIFMTDGDPNADNSMPNAYIVSGKTLTDSDNDGQTMDDAAFYLFDNDVCNQTGCDLTGKQNIQTYTIGFDIPTAAALLTEAATRGGGVYKPAQSKDELLSAFQQILVKALSDANATYVAPVIPRNPDNQTDAGDKVYMAYFKPQPSGRWIGNLKSYGLADGLLMDAATPPARATDSSGNILATSRSRWSTSADGMNVDRGGAGELLAARPLSGSGTRNVYTFTGTAQTALTHASNKFTDVSNNPGITASLLDVTSTTDRDLIISQTLAGTTVTRSDGTTIANWRLGDIVHSEPLVRNFEATYQNGVIDASEAIKSYIFVGANDGMLHVFNAADGSEAWSFIPPGQLARLKKRTTLNTGTEHNWFVDGSPVIEAVKKSDNSRMQLLIFGERRGGSNYYALDVTNPDQPEWKYQLTEALLTTLDWDGSGAVDGTAATLGQSWAKPQFKKVRSGSQTKEVFLFAGGYDPGYDSGIPANPAGRAIYTVQAETGGVFGLNINAGNWRDGSNNPYLTHAIVDVTGFDRSGFGYLDRVYAGDLGGNVFAARYNKCTNTECNDDVWEKMKLLDLPDTVTVNAATYSLGQKFMTKPEATIEANGSECIYFGTGDREHPTGTGAVDAFYAVCNRWEKDDNGVLKTLALSDLVDVTDNLVQQGTVAQQAQSNAALAAGYGWYLRMPNAGEKIVSTPKVLNKKIYFTTFTPGTASVNNDPCAVSYDYGVSRLYVLDYKTGGAVYDYNASNTLTKDDRSIVIGTSIAAEPVLTVSGVNTSLFVASGGRFQGYNIENSPLVRRYFWRQLK